jgi:hypothetical protein
MSVVSGIIGANATKSAANTQAAATKDASQVQLDMFNTQQDNQKPWLTAGTTAVNQLSSGTQPGGQFSTTPQFNFDPNSVNLLNDPGYKVRMQTGVDALAASGSAMGNLGSGNLGTALTKYGQDYGSQEYGAAYNRQYSSAMDQYNAAMNSQNTVFNRLSGIAGTGQVTANNLGAQGANVAGQIGQNTIAGGNAQAQGQIGSANAITQGITGTTQNAINLYGQYQQNQMYNNSLQNWNGSLGVVSGYDPYASYSGSGVGPLASTY